jgi:hypothetical protein
MGHTGLHALLARSLALPVAKAPWLRGVTTGIPHRTGPHPAQGDEPAPEPKATK